MHLYKLNTDIKIKDNFVIEKYINPDYIYIPYNNNKLKEVHINTNINDFKSSISGKITGIKKGLFNNKYQNTLVIANDYKETNNKKEQKVDIQIWSMKKKMNI